MRFEKDTNIRKFETVSDQRSKEAKFFRVLHNVYDVIERKH